MLTQPGGFGTANHEHVVARRDEYGEIVASAIADCQRERLLDPRRPTRTC